MLEQLLDLIRTKGTTSAITLAAQMKTTPRMVESMLDTLEGLGYLQSVEMNCTDASCGSCPVGGECSTNSPRIRVLKEPKIHND
jgi:hypothetical protein